jgi:hypothetical protein
MAGNEYKNCPFCDEEIKAIAIKCRYCESLLYKKMPGNKKAEVINNSIEKKHGIPLTEKFQSSSILNKKVRLIAAALVGGGILIFGGFNLFNYIFFKGDGNGLLEKDFASAVDALTEEEKEIVLIGHDATEAIDKSSVVDITEAEVIENGSNVISEEVEKDENQKAQGSISWDGGTYTGPLENGVPHGWGTWKDPAGKTYTGDFINGKMTGYGTMVFPGGIKYVGDFFDGKGHGQGIMTHPDGRSVSGTWVNGIYLED